MRSVLLLVLAASLFPLTASAQAADPSLSAGGLAPPPAVEGQAGAAGAAGAAGTPGAADQTLDTADREDSGRGLEFVWLNGEVGVSHVGLTTFKSNDLVGPGVIPNQLTGLVVGTGLGVRVIFMTLGARFRYGTAPAFKHWDLGAEGAVHFPFGSLEPYAGLGVGYVHVDHITETAALDVGAPSASWSHRVAGVDARLFGGLDYYLTNMFSVGANLSADMLFLVRKKSESADPASVYAKDGSSIGGGVSATAVLGLHF